MARKAKQLNIRPKDLLELQTMSRANRLGGIEKEAGFTLYPTHSSSLNQVGIWFNMLTRDVLKGGIWHSKKQLVDQLMD